MQSTARDYMQGDSCGEQLFVIYYLTLISFFFFRGGEGEEKEDGEEEKMGKEEMAGLVVALALPVAVLVVLALTEAVAVGSPSFPLGEGPDHLLQRSQACCPRTPHGLRSEAP